MNVRDIPKVELHRHLELSVRHSTLKELAPAFDIDVSTDQAFENAFLIKEPMKDLGAVLNKFLDTQRVMNSVDLLERLAFEACEDAVNENIKILELRYAPTFVVQNHKNLNWEKAHEAFVRGIRRAQREYNISVGLVCIIQRILPVKEAQAVTQFAIDNKDTFVGLDLADNEVGFDSKPFAPFFEKAKAAGLGITVHSGEANVPKAPRYVQDAIEYLGADRIGHGVQIYRDTNIMDFVKGRGVVLELCPTSNWLTQAVPSTKEHPFRKLMEYGVETTINSDDPGAFAIDLNNEYEVLQKEHDFTEEEFNRCNDIAAAASFIPIAEKQKYWPRHLKDS